MRVSAYSDPAIEDGDNEDWVSAAPGLIVVVDGATVRTQTGCSHGAAWYATQLGSALSTLASNRELALPSALRSAIQHVANQHRECNLNHPGTPSAAVAVLRNGRSELEYLVLGDITVVLESAGGLEVVVDDRVDTTARTERDTVDRYPIGSPEKQSALLRMKHAELAVRNQPGGYWVAAADPNVVTHAITGKVALEGLRVLDTEEITARRGIQLNHRRGLSRTASTRGTELPAVAWVAVHLCCTRVPSTARPAGVGVEVHDIADLDLVQVLPDPVEDVVPIVEVVSPSRRLRLRD